MKNRDISLIACRVIAIWVFAQAIMQITTLVVLFWQYHDLLKSAAAISGDAVKANIGLIYLTSNFVTSLVVSVILWIKAPQIAAWLAKGTSEDTTVFPIDYAGALRLVIIGLGFFAVLSLAPKIAATLIVNRGYSQRTGLPFFSDYGTVFGFVTNCITLGFGLLATLRSDLVVKLLTQRDTGRKENTQQGN